MTSIHFLMDNHIQSILYEFLTGNNYYNKENISNIDFSTPTVLIQDYEEPDVVEDSFSSSPLLNWTQTFIWNHQNPKVCPSSKSKYIVSRGHPWGLGSQMHVIGTHLACAIEKNLILVWGSSTCTRYVNSSCSSGCACLFEPLSHCSMASENMIDNYITGGPHDSPCRFLVPSRIKRKLRELKPQMTDYQMTYWWRGQSIAYLMRFNSDLRHHIQALRQDKSLFYKTPGKNTYSSNNAFFTFPRGTINAHIRRGDKYKEMRLIDDEVYIEAFVKMISEMPLHFSSHTIFLSSDDEEAIQSSKKKLESMGYSVIYSKIPRWKNGNYIEMMDTDEYIRKHRQDFAMYHLLELQMSMEADGWIGTRASNWNRMIDELRCIWVSKCQMPFVEVGDIHGDDYGW